MQTDPQKAGKYRIAIAVQMSSKPVEDAFRMCLLPVRESNEIIACHFFQSCPENMQSDLSFSVHAIQFAAGMFLFSMSTRSCFAGYMPDNSQPQKLLTLRRAMRTTW